MARRTGERWSRRRRGWSIVAVTALVLIVTGVIVQVVRSGAQAREVHASTLDSFPTRGTHADLEDDSSALGAAAETWRRGSHYRVDEPPDPDAQMEVLWAGDVPVSEILDGRPFPADNTDAETARLVVLRADDDVAALAAPVTDGIGEFRGLGQASHRSVGDDVAISAAPGVLLLWDDWSAQGELPTVELAPDGGNWQDTDTRLLVENRVADAGLILGLETGAIRLPEVDPLRYDPAAVFVLGRASGAYPVVESDDPDALWDRLTDSGAHVDTWSALFDAMNEVPQPNGAARLRVEWLGELELPSGAASVVMAKEARVTELGNAAVSASGEPLGGALSMGSGRPLWLGLTAEQLPVLAATWRVVDEEPMLLIAGEEGITGVEVTLADRTVDLDGRLAVLPRPDPQEWSEAPERVDSQRVPAGVVVGRSERGPVSILPDGRG